MRFQYWSKQWMRGMFECDHEQFMTMLTWHVPGPFVEKTKDYKRSPNSNGSAFT